MIKFKEGERIYPANENYAASMAKHGGQEFSVLSKNPSIPIIFKRRLSGDYVESSIEIQFTTDRTHTYWALASDFVPRRKPTIIMEI